MTTMTEMFNRKLAEIEISAKEKGISLASACREAGINQSTFFRWRTQGAPETIQKLDKLLEAAGCLD